MKSGGHYLSAISPTVFIGRIDWLDKFDLSFEYFLEPGSKHKTKSAIWMQWKQVESAGLWLIIGVMEALGS